jgi:2-keto-3-deoxy-L-rhamnonate aldolase RhmA
MQAAYRRVAETAGRHGIAAGLHPSDLAVVEYGRSVGMRCLMYSSEVRLLLGAARQAVQALRGQPQRQ